MAKFIPTGWKMSSEGAKLYSQHYVRVEQIVRKRVKKYNLTAIDPADLLQEGRLAAAYAVDTFQSGRGKLDGYVATVVDNALAMVAAEGLAQRRQPYAHIRDSEGKWQRIPVHCAELEDDIATDHTPNARKVLLIREECASREFKRALARAKLDALGLSYDARAILDIKLHPPAELWVLSRNLNRGRHRINTDAIIRFLGWTKLRLLRALKELRNKMYIELGVEAIP